MDAYRCDGGTAYQADEPAIQEEPDWDGRILQVHLGLIYEENDQEYNPNHHTRDRAGGIPGVDDTAPGDAHQEGREPRSP